MSLLFNKRINVLKSEKKCSDTSAVDSDSPYSKLNDGILIYQDKYGQWLDLDQQPRPNKPRKYNPHISTRYKNVIVGENGIAKAYNLKTKDLKDTDKALPELYIKKEKCCGCGACYFVCPVREFLKDEGKDSIGKHGEHYIFPHGAIYMEKDEEGFLYPVVDASLCIRCYKCEKVCPLK